MNGFDLCHSSVRDQKSPKSELPSGGPPSQSTSDLTTTEIARELSPITNAHPDGAPKHEVYRSQWASDGCIDHKDSHCSREAAGADSNKGQGQNLLLGAPASVCFLV
jgi:hypothetical protein